MAAPVIVVHGGADPILQEGISEGLTALAHEGLRAALAAGAAVLDAGGSALDAVTEAIKVLEDDPVFNAGRGASFTRDETHEMDASIMSGIDQRAGAVTGVCGPRHPILAARAVMERTPHVLLSGAGAMAFCSSIGLEMCDPSWFDTDLRLEELRRATRQSDHGTVGAVALDAHHDLAAATSTGGMTAKMPGRVGDSPIIGAGTWAVNGACAVSSTGHGEFFIRYAAAHEVYGRMKWGGMSLAQATDSLVNGTLRDAGAQGGVIAVDASGNVAMPFNCGGMFRGCAQSGVLHTGILSDLQTVSINSLR